ncbi:3D domain-containing protein [Paenibacillus sedimenti]|uniref:LysM peptidoglycan-binding domain-containing protein n=1 Tax=Paenibacillus sedimenti TaxID=2770274 RepID=A0A926KSP3_9BACL|nr:3D domain-containing protein [Paenibacillus sedimenti]MBD0382191.1 LysM peptidoglycan-binding domain-containing protein [Paenibacillus sedimenti]
MFRKIISITLVLPLLLGIFHVEKAYSYPASEDGGELSPAYSRSSYASPAESAGGAAETVLPPASQYQVNRGDTLYKIALSFGVSVNDLMAANAILDPRQLMIGQILSIPLSGSGIDLPDGQRKVIKKVLNTTLTAYTAGVESTGKKESHPMYGITYSGIKAKEGRTIAVDPAVIPLGSTVFIEGIGIRKAEDIGSAIRGSRIDVFMNDLSEAQEFGVKKNVKVYLLEKGNV